MANTSTEATTEATTDTTKALANEAAFELIDAYLSPHKASAFRALGFDAVQGRREGIRIWDLEGTPYINCRSSGGVFNFGHHPRFAVDALKQALDERDMGDWLLPSLRRAEAAQALAGILPGDLRYTFFTPSGAEAIEVACKLARGVTGRTGIVSAEHGYHGHVGFSLAMDEDDYSRWFRPLVPGIAKVPFGDADALDRAVDDQTAAVCFETIPATAGIIVPPDGYLEAARRICDEAGALLILDEVQAGLGRTAAVWACEHWGVVPDLLVCGKGLAVGLYPVSACSFGDRVEPFFGEDPFFHPSSYGGSELAATVVELVAERVAEPEFLAHVAEMGQRFEAGFAELGRRHPQRVAGHRAKGLMMALETHSEEQGLELTRRCIAEGLLAIFANNRRSSLLVMPPLVISAEEVDEVLTLLDRAVAAMQA
jgi:acetylornithine/succinyldiaminopimelate/putrescine aminotransferase